MAKVPYVDKDECTGCGDCVENCPEVFQFDEDDLAEVKNPNGASEEEIQDAIDNCPAEAIHWKE